MSKTAEERRKEEKARLKLDAQRADIMAVYQRERPDLRLDAQEFQFTAIRPGMGDADIDPLVESVEWFEEGNESSINVLPMLQGTVSLRKPHPDQRGADIDILDGHRIRCMVKWRGSWVPLWEMRIQKPTLGVADGSWGFELADDLRLLGQSRDDFRYKKGKKKRPNGWRYDEIVADICRRYKVPAGEMVRGKKQIKNFNEDSCSPLYAIRRAVEIERKHTGIPLVIAWRWVEGKGRFGLCITRLRRNPLLYVLEEQITGAEISFERSGDMATVIVARGKIKDGKKKKKRTIRVHDREAMRQYGYIRKPMSVGEKSDSEEEIRDAAEKRLEEKLEPTRRLTVTHPGIAFVRRGDAMRVNIKGEGLYGKQGVVFVQSVRHSLSAGSYTMDLTMSFTDPQDPTKLRHEREKALRARKRKENGEADDRKGDDKDDG